MACIGSNDQGDFMKNILMKENSTIAAYYALFRGRENKRLEMV